MSSLHHTRGSIACQPPNHPSYSQSVGDDRASTHTIDYRLAARYGSSVLSAGHTALPNLAYMYYARLGVTEAEFVFIAQLCSYWWGVDDPFPGEEAIAARMGKSKRTIQGYARSLERKGLLHISTQFSHHGRQETNSYNLRPFLRAIEKAAQLDGRLVHEPTAGPRHSAHDTESCKCESYDHNTGTGEPQSLCAGELVRDEKTGIGGVKNPSPQEDPIEKEAFDLVSIPPTPANVSLDDESTATQPPPSKGGRKAPHSLTPMATTGLAFSRPVGPPLCSAGTHPSRLGQSAAPLTPDEQALAATIIALGAEVGDDAPASSVTRAINLWRDAGISLDHFQRLVDEATARTRARQGSIVKRRRTDTCAVNGTPYLLAVLTDLLHPTPPRPTGVRSDVALQRAAPTGRQRRQRRAPNCSDPAISYAAWSNSPARLPITEEHPVWHAVLDELAQILTVENFNIWLASTRVVSQEGERLSVAVSKQFHKDWLEAKLQGRVMGALARLGYGTWQVQYVVDATASTTPVTGRAS